MSRLEEQGLDAGILDRLRTDDKFLRSVVADTLKKDRELQGYTVDIEVAYVAPRRRRKLMLPENVELKMAARKLEEWRERSFDRRDKRQKVPSKVTIGIVHPDEVADNVAETSRMLRRRGLKPVDYYQLEAFLAMFSFSMIELNYLLCIDADILHRENDYSHKDCFQPLRLSRLSAGRIELSPRESHGKLSSKTGILVVRA